MQRGIWTWLRTALAPYVPPSANADFGRARLYGQYSDGFTIYGPYRRPIVDATGGGELYRRQLALLGPNIVYPQHFTPVSIAGGGASLHGQFDILGLVNVTSNSGQGGAV